jgi:hypothetical protein
VPSSPPIKARRLLLVTAVTANSVLARAVRLARENPRWGYPRIVGECRNWGVRVSATSV